MKKSMRNENGFSAVEGFLILVILVIIGSCAWYVWHAQSQANKNLNSADSTANSIVGNKKTTKQSTANPSSSSSKTATVTPASPIPAAIVSPAPTYVTTTPTVVNNFITINEWKVKFKQNGTITIMYAHDSKDKNNRATFFSSSQLASKNKACKAELYPAGYIVRYKSTEHVYDGDKDSGKAATEYVGSLTDKNSYKQIGDYYYFYHGPKGKCADLKEVEDLQNQTAEAVKAFLTSLEAAN